MQLTKGTLFANQFRLFEHKGRGGYGEVWLAHDELHNMEVAIKIFMALDSQEIEVFKSEYGYGLELDHPNLLRAYHLGVFDNSPYLVMPYCPDSATILIGKVNEPTLWRFILDVASGLAYLHENGIVHNSIKPDNVLINQQDRFVITDYGITPQLRDTLDQNLERKGLAITGAPIYKAPELFEPQGSAVYATDIWALGATLYEMASHEVPLYGQGGHLLLKGVKISRPQWSYSENLTDTILQCLAKEAWNRPKAKDLVERAKDALAGHPYTGNVEESPKEETVHDNNKVEDPSANNILNPLPNNDPQEHNTSTKRKTVKVLGLVLVALLLGAVGFLGWKLMQAKSVNNDNLMFQNCKTGDDYRAYMKKYPDGVNFELAKSRLDEWVKDSINRTDTLNFVEPKQVEPVSGLSFSKTEEKKEGIKEETKTESTNNLEKGTTGKTNEKMPEDIKEETAKDKTNHQENDEQRKPKEEPTLASPQKGNSNLTSSNSDMAEPRSGLTKASNQSGHESNEPGLRPAGGGLSQTPSTHPSSEEEAYQRATAPNATLEDCLYWLDSYGDSRPQKWQEVCSKFRQLYALKLNRCKTVEDCERFLNEHDGIMKRARLTGSSMDKRMRASAEEKKKNLK